MRTYVDRARKQCYSIDEINRNEVGFMKKTLSFLTAASVAFSLIASPAAAESDMQRTLSLVKQRVGSTDGYKAFNSSEYVADGVTSYSFNWETSADDSYKYMDVTALKDGTITQYGVGDSSEKTDDRPTINRPKVSEAIAKTEALFAKINPELSKKVKISDDGANGTIASYNYSFRINRVENGIPVKNNDGYITLKSDLSALSDFYMDYSPNLKFAPPDGSINADAAKKAFAEKVGMRLIYEIKRDYEKNTISAAQVYIPKKENTFIDAFTGEARETQADFASPFRYSLGTNEFSTMDADGGKGGLSPMEIAETDTVAGLKSAADIEKSLRANPLLGITKDMKLERQMLSRDRFEKSKYSYSMSFESDSKSARAEVNAATGELLGFSRDYDNPENVKSLSDEKLKSAAVAAAQKLAPAHFKADGSGDYIEYPDYNLADSENQYVFIRVVNSIPCPSDRISIVLNPVDGSLTAYSFTNTDVEFPAVQTITAEQAAEKLFEHCGFDLAYIPEWNDAPLVYMPDDALTWVINAENGELDDASNSLTVADKYTDISGHYAETAINRLRDCAIGFSTEKFEPNKAITRREFANLAGSVLVWRDSVVADDPECTTYKDSDFRSMFDISVTDYDKPLTRIEAARAIVRALGGGEFAKLSGIYVPQFSDVSAEDAGTTAILSAMKIIGGSGGCFNPNAELTRADAFIMIYNYLNK